MQTYVIINKKTNRFLTGTDYRYTPPHQITSDSSMLTFDTMYEACAALRSHACNSNYVVALVTVDRAKTFSRQFCEKIYLNVRL